MRTLKNIENQKGYDELLKRVDSFLNDCEKGLVNLKATDPVFSSSDCQCCHRPLGGDRYACEYYDKQENLEHCDICIDCLTIIDTGQFWTI